MTSPKNSSVRTSALEWRKTTSSLTRSLSRLTGLVFLSLRNKMFLQGPIHWTVNHWLRNAERSCGTPLCTSTHLQHSRRCVLARGHACSVNWAQLAPYSLKRQEQRGSIRATEPPIERMDPLIPHVCVRVCVWNPEA